MAAILECADVYGRNVVLTPERWYNHILLSHAEMSSLLAVIERAVRQPDQVNWDADFPDREAYYLFSVAGTHRNRHVKVSIEYGYTDDAAGGEGQIITAYVTRAVKNGEVVKWRRKN